MTSETMRKLTVHCVCGTHYDIPPNVLLEDAPGLCPGCGGVPPRPSLDERAQEATELEERALRDFTSAMEAVRGKLCHYLGLDTDVPWERLTLAVEKVVIDRDNEKAGSANVFLAVNVVREQLWAIRDMAAKALGETPPESHGDEHLAVTYVKRLIARLEEQAEERSRMVATINSLEEDVVVLRRGDETQAGTWKAHFLDLAMAVGVPRPAYGVVTDPNVDAVMTYVGQVMPAYKLLQRVDALESRLDAMVAPKPAPKPPLKGWECPACGVRNLDGVVFCPECGREPDSKPAERCETCDKAPDDCYPDPPGSGSCVHYKAKGDLS